jgi:predicted dienelactone hydrolase
MIKKITASTAETTAAGLLLLASMILICGGSARAASTNIADNTDFSERGVLEVETMEFSNLLDGKRFETEPTKDRRPVFPRLRKNRIANNAHFRQSARRIPIKVHVPAEGGPYPIIVVSHGAGGNWDTHYGLAQHLASHGYAVFCVEHVGSNTDRLKSSVRIVKNLNRMIRDATEVLGRPKDVSFAIDRAVEWNESHQRLRGRLDTKRIGILGHSFGAYTTMVVCGMRPSLDWLEGLVHKSKGLGPSLRDARVACGVALSPQGSSEPFFIDESFASLEVPLMGISGTEDRQQGGLPPENRYKAFELWPAMQGQHKFVWLANANHFDFTDHAGDERNSLRSANREDVQRVVRAATLLFFNAHLDPAAAGGDPLDTEGLQRYLRGAIDGVEVRSR